MEKNGPPPAISADEAAFRRPPPAYEDVMGAYQTSVKSGPDQYGPSGAQIPPLSYIDIMPRCINPGNIRGKIPPRFDNFSCVLNAANLWLENNPGLAVWKCESINKRLNLAQNGSITYELNEMLRHESTFGYLVYIKGLRLWLTRSTGGPAQQLGLRNVFPETMNVALPVYTRGYFHPGKVTVAGETHELTSNLGDFRSYDSFEGLTDTVKRLRQSIRQDPIPGTILTIETDRVFAYEGFENRLDPEATSWSEDKDKIRRFTQVLRIFYIKGTPANEEIDFQEFVPEMTQAPDALKGGQLEDFGTLMHRLSGWVTEHQGIRIINIQQYYARVVKEMDRLKIHSDSTDVVLSTYGDQRYATTLRIFYAKPSSIKGIPAHFMSCRLFLPTRIGRKSFECMTQTMARIDAWLRVTGLPVYSVETVEMFFNETNPAGADFIKTDFTMHSVSGKSWLTGIRVYFSQPYQEPSPALLPPAMPYYTDGGSSACDIL